MTGVAPPDPRNIVGHVPGRLCVGVTNLATAFPHGGTALGEVEDAVLVLEAPHQLLTAEEWGNEVHDAIAGGEVWSMAGLLREWNATAYAAVFLNAAAGSVSKHPLVTSPGTNRAGYAVGARAAVYCFSPMNTELHPFVVFHSGLPMVEDTAEMALHLGGDANRLQVPFVIVARRSSAGKTVSWGRYKDITL